MLSAMVLGNVVIVCQCKYEPECSHIELQNVCEQTLVEMGRLIAWIAHIHCESEMDCSSRQINSTV